MRWRLLVLGALGLVLAVAVGLSAWRSAELTSQAQGIFVAQNQNPTQKQQDEAIRKYQEASILQSALTPLGTAALLCGLGIPVVLARRWQLREARESAEPRPVT